MKHPSQNYMPKRRYSSELIKECQRVISKRAGFPISEDQAEIYLETLARLGNLALRVLAAKNNSTNDKSDAIGTKEIR